MKNKQNKQGEKMESKSERKIKLSNLSIAMEKLGSDTDENGFTEVDFVRLAGYLYDLGLLDTATVLDDREEV